MIPIIPTNLASLSASRIQAACEIIANSDDGEISVRTLDFINPRKARMTLDFMADLGLLVHRNRRYIPSPQARVYFHLLRNSPDRARQAFKKLVLAHPEIKRMAKSTLTYPEWIGVDDFVKKVRALDAHLEANSCNRRGVKTLARFLDALGIADYRREDQTIRLSAPKDVLWPPDDDCPILRASSSPSDSPRSETIMVRYKGVNLDMKTISSDNEVVELILAMQIRLTSECVSPAMDNTGDTGLHDHETSPRGKA